METNHSDQSVDKSPDAKRPKMEMEAASSTSTKPKFTPNNDNSPILTLPADILAKIIAFVPTAQWPSFDLLKDFHDASRIAWRDLRSINLDRGLLIKPDRLSLAEAIEYLVERSPFLTSLSGIDLRVESNSDVIRSLAKFEHLQSITMGDARLDQPDRLRWDALVEFFDTTRSRTNLKQMQLFNIQQSVRAIHNAAILDQFQYVRGFGSHEWIQIRRLQPFKLEKFSFSSFDRSLFIRLDTLDASCLTELRLGVTNIGRTIGRRTYDRSAARFEPDQLTNLIDRAPNLDRIELFLGCEFDCRQERLGGNRELLAALARHENLTTIKFDFDGGDCGCLYFAPDFIEMLKAIGRRGKLRKLVLPPDMNCTNIDRNEMCSTIHDYIPYLQSIKLCFAGVNRDIVSNILSSMVELEEVHFPDCESLDANAITKISQLSNLKRLAIDAVIADWNSPERLANATTLTDLRIRYAQNISPDIFKKWSKGFGSNLKILMFRGYQRGFDDYDDEDEGGLIHLLEKAVRLRILILEGFISDRSMMAIAQSCPQLEILGVRSAWNAITARGLQEVVDRCSMLRRLGGISDEIRSQLVFPKYRKIGDDVDMEFWKYDFDDRYYE